MFLEAMSAAEGAGVLGSEIWGGRAKEQRLAEDLIVENGGCEWGGVGDGEEGMGGMDGGRRGGGGHVIVTVIECCKRIENVSGGLRLLFHPLLGRHFQALLSYCCLLLLFRLQCLFIASVLDLTCAC